MSRRSPLLLALFLSGCGAHKVIEASKLNTQSNYCAPTITYTYDPANLPLANPDSTLGGMLSPHDQLTANAIGILPLIPNLLRANGLHRLELKSQIHGRLLSASTEINSVAAELDCEGERADQLALYLDNLNKKQTNALTAASILAAAGTTLATVLINGTDAKNTVAIGGGLLSAGLTAFTISPRGRRIRLFHDRNLLRDVWYAPVASTVYPPSVWYILREKAFSNGGQVSLLESIHRRWVQFELSGQPDSARQALLFGGGGVYTADDLHTRANMLNQLQATVRAINQDLQGLMLALDRLP